jgi:hypothetical protein
MNVESQQRAPVRPRLFAVTLRSVAFASLLAIVSGTACSKLIPPGPTPVAQGKYYGSGNAEYDAFFLDLYRTQVHAATLPERVAQSRNTLTDGLTVSRDLTTGAIVEHVRARAQDLGKQGVLMKLDTKRTDGGPATAVLLTRPSARSATTRQLAEPIEKSSNELLAVNAELETTGAQLERLDQKRAELLERAHATFEAEGPSKIGEVGRNLEDARQVLELMRTRVAQYRKDTQELLTGLTSAVDTAGGAFERPEPAPEVAEEPKTTKRKPGRSTSGSGKGSGSPRSSAPKSSAPKPAPAPKAPASDGGFEP